MINDYEIKNSNVMQKARGLLEPLKLNVARTCHRCDASSKLKGVLPDKVLCFHSEIFDVLKLY